MNKNQKLILMSGPCVIESEEQLSRIAEGIAPIAQNPRIDFYFKASFDKANRTSLEAYRGPGLDKGLKMLESIKKDFGYKIITDIHESHQASPIAEVADIIQIPAFLCRQTDLVVEVAKKNCIINIKKGQFMNPKDMRYSVLKALKTRDNSINEASFADSLKHKVWLTERGASFGYGNLVVDMRSLVIMREFAPVIFDATHSVQMPGAAGGKSGGDSSFVPYLARAAAAVGVDGFFMETHYDPANALSDGANMIPLHKLEGLIKEILALQDSLNLAKI
ncbi:3-deoxy-8-phosphooctulonate synthase [Helicobacter sp. T3_23-1056]